MRKSGVVALVNPAAHSFEQDDINWDSHRSAKSQDVMAVN